MPHSSIPAPLLRTAHETAARNFEAQRGGGSAVQPNPQGAARQIANPNAPVNVEQAIATAAQQTTADFDFLVAQAQVESAMNPVARARTSSATGLYQFIESTWLETMHRHGERFGLGEVSAQIGMTSGGSAYVSDPQAREAILALRNDPQIASLMAAGLAEDNRAHLAPILGRQPEHSELYLAHFLGAGGAGRFLSAMAQDPNQSAAALFRRPAAANRPVFYEPSGAPRSLAGVMDFLSAKLERARANAPASPPQTYAAASLAPPSYAGGISQSPIAQSYQPRPEYLIADEDVFGPLNPPTLTGRNRPTIAAGATLSLAPTSTRGSMSSVLRTAFGENGTQSSAESSRGSSTDQIARAYERLKSLGF